MGSQMPTHFPCWCRAIYDWTGETEDDLPVFEPGDVIECFEVGEDGAWWTGRLWRNGEESEPGIFPSNFVSLISDEEGESAKYTSPLPPPPLPSEPELEPEPEPEPEPGPEPQAEAAAPAHLSYESVPPPIEEEDEEEDVSASFAPRPSAPKYHSLPLKSYSPPKAKRSTSTKPEDYRTHVPRSLSPGPPSRFAVENDEDDEDDDYINYNAHKNAALNRSQSFNTYTPRNTYANASSSSGYLNDFGVSRKPQRLHSNKKSRSRQGSSPTMSPMTPGTSNTSAPFYQNGYQLPPTPLSHAWSQSTPSIPYVDSDPNQESVDELGPPPPPPPHRIVVNKVRGSPYAHEYSPSLAGPIHEEEPGEVYAETEQPLETYRSRDSPSPFRDALENVIESLNGMGLGIDTGQSKIDAADLGFENDYYGSPESQHTQSYTQPRPRKTKTRGIVQPDGPPQLGNYVQRMESHLKGLHSQDSHGHSHSHSHSPSMSMRSSVRKQSDELHITPKTTPDPSRRDSSRPSSQAWDRGFNSTKNMYRPQSALEPPTRPMSSMSTRSSRASRVSHYYTVNPPTRPQSQAF